MNREVEQNPQGPTDGPASGLVTRRAFLIRSARVLAGAGATAVLGRLNQQTPAHAQEAPESQVAAVSDALPPTPIPKPDQQRVVNAAINRVNKDVIRSKDLFPLTGQFYKTTLESNDIFQGISEGYFVDGKILEAYKSNGEAQSAWGTVRSQPFKNADGQRMQVFANALIKENTDGSIAEIPVLKTLEDEGLGAWLDEYGFKKPDVPLWKAVMASRRLAPIEAFIPSTPDSKGYYPDENRPFPVFFQDINDTESRLIIFNLDPKYGVNPTNPDKLAEFMSFGHDGVRIRIITVSSDEQIPAPLGNWKQGDDKTLPYVRNYSGGASRRQWIIKSPDGGNTFDFYTDLTSLRDPNLDPATKEQFMESYAGSLYTYTGTLLIINEPEHQWSAPAELDVQFNAQTTQQERNTMIAFDAGLTKNNIQLFPVVPKS